MFYRVRDHESGDIIIPFDSSDNSTKLSSDSTGMYFDFYMSSLPRGRSYVFDYLIKQNGFDECTNSVAALLARPRSRLASPGRGSGSAPELCESND